ncbi:SLAC1 anion channel family protein [Paludibacterium sp.]|uniref:SLAC1 anion channel family protein n=1 Tax=Paludibacterium sp. TaxID=1917523 RepID=UPI0025FED5BD|nr:SLAC1 anion channel family protein [Paludibacterium sp.]MBV8648973.1 SLAC1 anion channel family protein [Paludibacterium sp.]
MMSIVSTAPAPTERKTASIRNLPVNLFASVIGLAGLSIAWRQASHEFGVSPIVANGAGLLAFAAFFALSAGYLMKWVKHPDAVMGEYQHPIVGNFFGTIFIGMLLLSAVAAPVSAPLAEIIWTIASLATLTLCFAISSRLLRGQIDVTHVAPAWFIPGVATLDIAVTGGDMPMAWAHEVNLFALAIGTVIALLFFTMIMARIIHHAPLPSGMVPSLLILMAPFEVGFLAYGSLLHRIDTFSAMLFYFGLFIFLTLAPKVFRGGIPFTTSWWSISFPMAVLAIAALKYSMFVQAWPMKAIAAILLALLSLAIAVLLVRTLRHLATGKLLAG